MRCCASRKRLTSCWLGVNDDPTNPRERNARDALLRMREAVGRHLRPPRVLGLFPHHDGGAGVSANFNARRFVCDYCGATRGEPCRTVGGKDCQPHVSRVIQENDAWLRDHPTRAVSHPSTDPEAAR